MDSAMADYIEARAGLLGKEGDIDQLWKVIVAADQLVRNIPVG